MRGVGDEVFDREGEAGRHVTGGAVVGWRDGPCLTLARCPPARHHLRFAPHASNGHSEVLASLTALVESLRTLVGRRSSVCASRLVVTERTCLYVCLFVLPLLQGGRGWTDPWQCEPCRASSLPAKLDTPLLKGTLPFTILRKHPIVPCKIEVPEDPPPTQQEGDQEQQQQQQLENQAEEQQTAPDMPPNTPENTANANFTEEEEEGYPETTALLTPSTAPTVVTPDSPTWPAPSPPSPIARNPGRRDSEVSDTGGATTSASGKKIIRHSAPSPLFDTGSAPSLVLWVLHPMAKRAEVPLPVRL
ncbi:hypothetical protein E2C01_049955 [Portunus trituberculatus]|uniref:Uncharacterized protein n=1 Tax=Portunus trituberculatus TaxID=210409 RepID=A0A5B7GEM3_PORTR|nr:hypothetical protein [Portunus trituberculatus]